MIEIIVKFDDEKTEKAITAVSKITGLSIDELVKEWTDHALVNVAKASKRRTDLSEDAINNHGKDVLIDLLGILP